MAGVKFKTWIKSLSTGAPAADDVLYRVDDAGDADEAVTYGQLETAILAAGAAQFAPMGSPIRGTTVLFDGDSYAYVSGQQSYADNTIRQGIGISAWLQWYMHGRLRPLGNLGVSGETTAQFLSRIAASTAVGADICVLISPGVNDVKGGVDVATTIANLTDIFDAHNAVGTTVVTITCPPSDLIDTTAEEQRLFTLNRWLIDEGATRPGLVVVDVYPYVANPASIDFRSGYSTDGTHPNATGSHAIGKLIATALDKIIPSTGSLLTVNNADPYELSANPRMEGDSSGVATSVTSTGGTGTASKVARTDGIPGDWQRWDGTSGLHFFFKSVTSGYSAGQRLVARMEINAPDSTDWGAISENSLYVEQRNSGNTVIVGAGAVSVGLTVSTDAPRHDRIIVETNPVVVHADAVGGAIRFGHRFNGAGKIDIGALSLRVIDT